MIRRAKYQIPNKLYPYNILEIDGNTSLSVFKKKFHEKINSPDREQRAFASLAYDMITSRSKNAFKKNQDLSFEVVTKDHFYFVSIGCIDSLRKIIEKDKNVLSSTDELGRSLLYKAARNGFFDICKFLLESGCSINKTQCNGSTALHAASYYGHKLIVELLLEYSINIHIKNEFNNLAIDEAHTNDIRHLIRNSRADIILNLLNEINSKNMGEDLISIKSNNKIIGKKIVIHKKEKIDDEWVRAWHGTKFNSLLSIAENGLKAPGSKLSTGKVISTQQGHIKLGTKLGKFEDWASAVFLSPSIFYASDVVYAERIMSSNVRYCCLIEAYIKKNTFTQHSHTLLARENVPGEPESLEYRVDDAFIENSIYRVESNKNILIESILFASVDYLEKCKSYQDANVFEISKS